VPKLLDFRKLSKDFLEEELRKCDFIKTQMVSEIKVVNESIVL
jgi:hypothetical protein